MNAPRLIIADDSTLMRQAIQAVLNAHYEVVASVENGEAAIAAAARLSPELVLLDISMPGLNGLEAGRQIKRDFPVIQLIFVSEHAEKSYVDAGFSAGASGYVLKTKMVSELLPAIRSVLAGEAYGRVTAH